MRFRKKPIVIEARQFEPHLWREFEEWGDKAIVAIGNNVNGEFIPICAHIKTFEGTMTAIPGDWIIKGIKGEFYPIKNDIFQETYEVVE